MLHVAAHTGSLIRAYAVPKPVRFGEQAPPLSQAPELIETVKNKGTFDHIITQSTVPVLVKFEKKNCPGCVAIQPTVDQLAQENQGQLKVIKAWMWDEENPDNRSMKRISGEYKFNTVPYFILFKQGKPVARGESTQGLSGIMQEQGLKFKTYPDHLPKPYEPLGAVLTILFDGECRICRATAEKMKTLDKNNRLALVPLQAPKVREKYPDLKLVDLRKTLHVVSNDGKVYTGAAGFREVGKVIKPHTLMGFTLKAFKFFSKIPGVLPLTDKIYLAFSKRRFMFEAKKADCKNCSLEE